MGKVGYIGSAPPLPSQAHRYLLGQFVVFSHGIWVKLKVPRGGTNVLGMRDVKDMAEVVYLGYLRVMAVQFKMPVYMTRWREIVMMAKVMTQNIDTYKGTLALS